MEGRDGSGSYIDSHASVPSTPASFAPFRSFRAFPSSRPATKPQNHSFPASRIASGWPRRADFPMQLWSSPVAPYLPYRIPSQYSVCGSKAFLARRLHLSRSSRHLAWFPHMSAAATSGWPMARPFNEGRALSSMDEVHVDIPFQTIVLSGYRIRRRAVWRGHVQSDISSPSLSGASRTLHTISVFPASHAASIASAQTASSTGAPSPLNSIQAISPRPSASPSDLMIRPWPSIRPLRYPLRASSVRGSICIILCRIHYSHFIEIKTSSI